jgi:outer membrane protein assembly factor BamD (BamD/ComL family)
LAADLPYSFEGKDVFAGKGESTMSVAGITSLFNYATQNIHNNRQQFQQEFKQLGRDLQSGNLSAAQSDFASLEKLQPSLSAASTNPMAQAYNQLSTDLQSGNLSAAQQDYSNIQQHYQSRAAHMHHHHGGSGGGDSTRTQLIDQLGQALQSGDLTAAQKTYTKLQQDFHLFAQNHGPSPSSGNAVSISA